MKRIFYVALLFLTILGAGALAMNDATIAGAAKAERWTIHNDSPPNARSWVGRAGEPPGGDPIFQTAGGEEVLRFKPGGKVIANPKLKPDDAARAVLSAIYQLALRYFCRNPDDPAGER